MFSLIVPLTTDSAHKGHYKCYKSTRPSAIKHGNQNSPAYLDDNYFSCLLESSHLGTYNRILTGQGLILAGHWLAKSICISKCTCTKSGTQTQTIQRIWDLRSVFLGLTRMK